MNSIFKIKFWVFFFALLTYISSFSQNWTTYSTGSTSTTLTNNRVQALAKDALNNIWIGTYNGVSCYNGSEWKNYTINDGLIGNDVTSISIDSKGIIWFGTSIGVSKYDGKTWKSFKLADHPFEYQKIQVFTDNNDNVFVGSNFGLYTIADDEIKKVKDNNELLYRFTSFTCDLNNNLWFTTNSQIVKYDGVKFSSFHDSCLLTLGTIFYDITCDKKSGSLYAASDRGIFKFDGQKWSKFLDDKGISVFVDSKNTIWIGGDNSLLKIQDSHIEKFQDYTKINSLVEDRENNILFSMDTCLLKYDGKEFSKIVSNSNFTAKSIIVVDKEGNKWFGGVNSITKFDGRNWTNYIIPQLEGTSVSSMAIDKYGSIWFVNQYGQKLFKFNSDETVELMDEAEEPSKISVTGDKDGNIWYCLLNGIVKYDGPEPTYYKFPDNLEITSDIEEFKCIATDNYGVVWIGNDNLASFDGKDWKQYKIEAEIQLYEIHSIKADKENNIWVGAHGIVKITGSEIQAFSLQDYDVLNQYVYSIAIDSNDVKWFGTLNGVFRYNNSEMKLIAEEDGIASGSVNSITVDNKNNIWLVTDQGVSVYEENKQVAIRKPQEKKLKDDSFVLSIIDNVLTIKNIDKGEVIVIFNLLGNKVYNNISAGNTENIDVAALKPGIYLVSSGNMTSKFIKK